ncbi:MAG: hypothetical protein ABJN62_18735 [Halioglobus sp.]
MKLPTYQLISQISAAVVVAISLGFVAYELKLSRDIAKAEIFQARITMEQDWLIHIFDAELLAEAGRKLANGQELSKEEVHARLFAADMSMIHTMNVFYQHQLGLLDDDEWSTWNHGMEWRVTTPCYREFFESERGSYRKDFAVVIEKALESFPKTDCPIWDSE